MNNLLHYIITNYITKLILDNITIVGSSVFVNPIWYRTLCNSLHTDEWALDKYIYQTSGKCKHLRYALGFSHSEFYYVWNKDEQRYV